MHLLSPIYLLGLAAVALPVLIHLIRHRKVTVVAWAAHRFLQAVVRRLQRRRRLNDLILLLLRCLLFILVALLFARPFIGGGQISGGDGAQVVLLLLDGSGSMGTSNGVRSGFDQARDRALEVLDTLPPTSSAGLILFAGRAVPLVSPPVRELDTVRRELERAVPMPAGSDLAPALEAGLEMLKGMRNARIVVITDGRQGVWADRAKLEQLGEVAAAGNISLEVIDTSETGDLPNLGLVSLESSTARPVAGQSVALGVGVRNGGTQPSERTRLIFETGKDFPVGEAWVPALRPGASTVVQAKLRFDKTGWQTLTARLPGDGLAMDDSRTIGLQVRPRLNVVLVQGASAPGRGVPPGFFLEAAAVPVPVAQERDFPVAVTTLQASQLDAAHLQTGSVVMLAGLTELGRGQELALKEFVRNGGGLLITPPAAEAVRTAYLTRPPLEDLLPMTDLSFVEAEATYATAPPYTSPITAFWNDSAAGSLEAFIVQDHLRGTLRDNASPVLPLADGDPLFATQSVGAGRVFFSTVPLEGSWSDLPLSPQFVPLVQRTLEWLSLQSEATPQVAPGERWSLTVPLVHAGQPFYVAGPLNPDEPQLAGEVELVKNRALINEASTREPGAYRVYLDPAGPPVGAFGVNPDTAESDLRPTPNAEVPEWAYAALSSGGTTGPKAGPLTRWLRALPEPWVLLAYAILLLGAVELYLAQRFSRPT
ncbi:MAG: VWA domain-containing protein [Verrucomicrobiota bacterium JB024]|nr:VWA domain-containing protein [Verrucomicrobiota bacterium JB024]